MGKAALCLSLLSAVFGRPLHIWAYDDGNPAAELLWASSMEKWDDSGTSRPTSPACHGISEIDSGPNEKAGITARLAALNREIRAEQGLSAGASNFASPA